MELALSLGYTPKPFSCVDTPQTDLGLCMGVGKVCGEGENNSTCKETTTSSSDPPVHTFHPSPNNFPFTNWLTQNLLQSEEGILRVEKAEEGPSLSSPNSTMSSFQMEIQNLRNFDDFRGTDEETENYGSARKKLRLSKQQSAFLEDSFKEHSTLNPKEKLALAKRLNLQPRQVEVWFQNRRARTKLKQTEVDCEYLKRCCERLREENRRLQKEIQELRALNASKPFYMQLPATTLTMCPNCERVATAAAAVVTPPATAVVAAAGDAGQAHRDASR